MTHFIIAYEYTWWRGDPLPALPPLAGFQAERSDDLQLLADLHELDRPAIAARLQGGNRAYVAFLEGTPAAYGWTATQHGSILEAGLEWDLTPEDHFLWNFVTLPAWRGRGLYPHLLQAILRAEVDEAPHFWIGHRADNTPSRQGIVKAGFQLYGLAVMTAGGQGRLVPRGNRERAFASPFGQRLGFLEAPDEELAVFDFDAFQGRS